MITKKLMHDVITFCNTYIDDNNIIISVSKYSTFISLDIEIWKIGKNNSLEAFVGGIPGHIHSKSDLNEYKEKVLKELPVLLKKL